MNLQLNCLLIIMCAFLANCSNNEQLGTSSGGGGFVDTSAKVYLDLAKYSLAEIVANSSDEIYKNFPENKGKDWLIKIIKNTEVRAVDESRYGRALKFNYDLKTEKIYATNSYIQTVVDQRPWILNAKSKMEVLVNLHLDILHEISHFYGVGVTSETDWESDIWAKKLLLEHIGTEKVSCINRDETILDEDNVLARVVVVNPSTGFSYHGRISHENHWEDYEKNYLDPSFNLIVPAGMQYDGNNNDFIFQYLAMVNLALKHISIDELPGVIPTLSDLNFPPLNLNLMHDDVTNWNLLPVGHLNLKEKNRISFKGEDMLDVTHTYHDLKSADSKKEEYLLKQLSSFEIDLITGSAQYKSGYAATDEKSENYLKSKPYEQEKTLNFSCEYFVKEMEF